MTETFTFKPSLLELMPLRYWLAFREINRRNKEFYRLSPILQKLVDTDICDRTQILYKKVQDLWKHFGITPSNIYTLSKDDIQITDIEHLYHLNFHFTQEYNQYTRMLHREEADKQRLNNRVRSHLPSWIRSEERRQRTITNDAKCAWKDRWFGRYFPASTGVNKLADAVIFFIMGFLILSVIMVVYSAIMFYKDQWLTDVVRMMVDQSVRNGASFIQVYSAFGAAIIIILSFLISLFFAFKFLSREEDNLSSSIPEALTEIAYAVEHQAPASNAENGEPGPVSGIVS